MCGREKHIESPGNTEYWTLHPYALVVTGIMAICLVLFFGAIHAISISFDAGLAFTKLFFILAVVGWFVLAAIKSIIFFWK